MATVSEAMDLLYPKPLEPRQVPEPAIPQINTRADGTQSPPIVPAQEAAPPAAVEPDVQEQKYDTNLIGQAIDKLEMQTTLDMRDRAREADVMRYVQGAALEPGKAAEVMKYAAVFPEHPPAFIANNLDEIRTKVRESAYDWEELARTHPAFSKLIGDPSTAALVRDDSSALTWLETAITGRWEDVIVEEQYTDPNTGITAMRKHLDSRLVAPPALAAAIRDAFRGDSELMWWQTQRLVFGDQTLPDFNPATGRRYGAMTGPEEEREKKKYNQWLKDHSVQGRDYVGNNEAGAVGTGKRFVAGAFLFPVKIAPMIVGSVGAGAVAGPAGVFAFNTAYTAPGMYDRLADMKSADGTQISPTAARVGTLIGAPIIGRIMSAGMGNILVGPAAKMLDKAAVSTVERALADQTLMGAFGNWASRAAPHLAEGAATFAFQSGADAGIEQLTRSWGLGERIEPGPSGRYTEQVTDAMWEGFKEGLVSMPIFAAWSGGRDFLHDVGRMKRAAETRVRMQIMSDAAEAAKHPEMAEKLAAGSAAAPGSATHVYLDIETVKKVAESAKLDPREVMAKVFGDGGEAWDAAAMQGAADLAVPIAKAQRHLAGSKVFGPMMVEEGRFDPRDVSFAKMAREVERWTKLAEEAGEKKPEAMDVEERAIYESMRTKVKNMAEKNPSFKGQADVVADSTARLVLKEVVGLFERTGRKDPLIMWYDRTFGPTGIWNAKLEARLSQTPQEFFPVGREISWKKPPDEQGREFYAPAEIMTWNKAGDMATIRFKNAKDGEALTVRASDLMQEKMTSGRQAVRTMEVGPEVMISASMREAAVNATSGIAEGEVWGGLAYPYRPPAKVTKPEIKWDKSVETTRYGKDLTGRFAIKNPAKDRFIAYEIVNNRHMVVGTFPTLEAARAAVTEAASVRENQPLQRHILMNVNSGPIVLAHELAHTFANFLGDLAHQHPEIKALHDQLAEALGYKADGTKSAGDVRNEQHQAVLEERLAHAFEQYLINGKSPSLALAPVFARFMAWGSEVAKNYGIDRGEVGTKRWYDRNYDPRDYAAIQAGPAWHGTRYREIDRFMVEHIGKGQGAQSYGCGLYFAEHLGTAEDYRRQLSDIEITVSGHKLKQPNDSPMMREVGIALEAAVSEAKDLSPTGFATTTNKKAIVDQAIKGLEEKAAKYRSMSKMEPSVAEAMRVLEGRTEEHQSRVLERYAEIAQAAEEAAGHLRITDPAKIEFKEGQTYQVEVPDKSELLDYDAPLRLQPPGVREKLEALMDRIVEAVDEARNDKYDPWMPGSVSDFFFDKYWRGNVVARGTSGQSIYLALKKIVEFHAKEGSKFEALQNEIMKNGDTGRTDEAASKYLRDLGIPGLMYLDAGSRAPHFEVKFDGLAPFDVIEHTSGPGEKLFMTMLSSVAEDAAKLQRDTGRVLGVEMLIQKVKDKLVGSEMREWKTIYDAAVRDNVLTTEAEVRAQALDALKEAVDNGRIEAGMTEQTHNFVIWDDSRVEIKSKLYPSQDGSQVTSVPQKPRVPALSEPIKKVFDSMLATTEEIQAANELVKANLPFVAATKNMTEEEKKAYAADLKGQEGSAQAVLLHQIIEATRRENSTFMKKELDRFKAEVQEEMKTDPVYRALKFFRTGEGLAETENALLLNPEGKPYRFGADDLIARYGKQKGQEYIDLLRSLSRHAVTDNPKLAMDADLLAGFLGFSKDPMVADGTAIDKMMAAFRTSLPETEHIERESMSRLRNKYQTDLIDQPQVLRGLALDAVINEKMAAKVLKEMAALARSLDPDRAARSESASAEQLKAVADKIISLKSLRDIRADKYAGIIGTATVKARDFAKAGEMAKAWDASEAALLNIHLYKAAREMEKLIDKSYEVLSEKATSDSWRGKLGLADVRYQAVHDAILEAVGMKERHPDAKPIDPAVLGEFIKAAEERGQAGQIDGWDLDGVLTLLSGKKAWNGLTPGEAANVFAAILNIKHLADGVNEIRIDGKNMALDEAALLLKADLETRPFKGKAPTDMALVARTREPSLKVKGFLANAEEFRTQVKKIGPNATRLLYDEYVRAKYTKFDLQQLVTGEFKGAYEAMPKEVRDRAFEEIKGLERELPIPEDVNLAGPVSRSWLWMIMLNMGNEGNRKRLLSGMGWNVDQVIDAAQKHLSPAEMQFVQKMWDLSDKTLWPKVVEKEMRRTGLRPDEVRPMELKLTFDGVEHTYTGGYFPAKYDPRASQRRIDAAIERTSEGPVRMRPGTLKSYTRNRVENYSDIVNLEWSVLPSHFAEVIHDLAFDEYVRNTNKLIFNKKNSIPDVMYQRLGEEGSKQPRAFLEAVAHEQADPVAAHMARALGMLEAGRSRIVYGALGYNVPVAMADFLHPIAVAAFGRIKVADMAKSLAETPLGYSEMRAFALERSKELMIRQEHGDVKLREELLIASRGGTPSGLEKALGISGPDGRHGPLAAVRRSAFYLLDRTDRIVSTQIWMAKYREVMRLGGDEKAAVWQADDAVRESMPTHTTAELPGFLRDKKTMGALLIFQGYYSKLLQMSILNADPAYLQWKEPNVDHAAAIETTAVAAARIAAGLAVASIMGDYVMGHGKEEDETWGEWFGRKATVAPFTMVPFASNLAEPIADVAWTGKVRKFSVRNAPALAAIQQVTETVGRLASDQRTPEQKTFDVIELALFGLRLPARQPRRSAEYLLNVGLGEEDPEGVLDFFSGVAYGKRRKQAANPVSDLSQALEE